MEKKRVRPQVINGDWEIKKNRMRQNLKAFKEKAKPVMADCGKCLLLGAGIGVVVILNDRLS